MTRTSRTPTRSAVTLAELVITIVLISILASAAVAGLVGIQTWRRAAAVRRVHADLSYARALAMLSSRRTFFQLDANDQTYEVRQEATPGGGTIAATVLNHPVTGAPWRVAFDTLAAGLRLKQFTGDDPTGVGFAPDGRPVQSSGALASQDVRVTFGDGQSVVVHADSGLCEVQ